MRKTMVLMLALGAGVAIPAAQAGDAVDPLLERYRAAGAGPFDAKAGEALWHRSFTVAGEARSCGDCHGSDLKAPGRHARTGKPIEPMAPSANGQRLTEVKQMEKWLLRNCKWTVGRECSPQERGDLLVWLRTQ